MQAQRGTRAQAMVETAVVFPLLLVATLGVVQFALWMHARDVVIAAVQDGARVASSEGGSLADGLAEAEALLRAGLGPSATRVTVVPSEDGTSVRFDASGELPAIVPLGALPLHATASMARERFRP